MSEAVSSVEGLLQRALSPVEPPEDLVARLEGALTNLAEIAVEELEAWELSAMRDPRNWARPAAALLVGTTAGAALVVLRSRHRGHPEPDPLQGAREAAGRLAGDMRAQAHRLLGGR
jgi:hypothetical protein